MTYLLGGVVPVSDLIPSVRWGALSQWLSSAIITIVTILLKVERGDDGGRNGYEGEMGQLSLLPESFELSPNIGSEAIFYILLPLARNPLATIKAFSLLMQHIVF